MSTEKRSSLRSSEKLGDQLTCHLKKLFFALELDLISFLVVNPYHPFNHTLGRIKSLKCYNMGLFMIVNIIIVLKIDNQYALAQLITAMVVLH